MINKVYIILSLNLIHLYLKRHSSGVGDCSLAKQQSSGDHEAIFGLGSYFALNLVSGVSHQKKHTNCSVIQ